MEGRMTRGILRSFDVDQFATLGRRTLLKGLGASNLIFSTGSLFTNPV
jgi:hypothetical protein